MAPHILPIFTFFCMALVVSHAAVPPEIFWKNELPNTPMPKAIKNSLPTELEYMESKDTSVSVGKGGVNVNTGGAKQQGGTSVNVGPKSGVGVSTENPKPQGGHTDVSVGPKSGVGVSVGKPNGGYTGVSVGPKSGVGVSTGKPDGGHTDVHVSPKTGITVSTGKPGKGGATVGVGKGGVIVRAGGPKKKHVYVGVKPGADPFNYVYGASETQLHDDPTRALFFLEKDMKVGSPMTLHFTKTSNDATFLPKDQADAIPFTSNKMPEILHEFSVEPGTEEARVIQATIKGCEAKGIQGEKKHCATSLESMVDYATSTLGKNVKALSTSVNNGAKYAQKYTIVRVGKISGNGKAAVCHKQKYPFAVFYCHKTKATSAYMVTLKSIANGTLAKAVAICHRDTSKWNPKHLAFQVLNVKPGSVPVCHFLPEDHIVWVPNN